jgi:hypothetical protein
MLALPQGHAEGCQRWRHATQLLLEHADVAAVSIQVSGLSHRAAAAELNARGITTADGG